VKDIKDGAGKTIEVFSYNFELNQEVSLVFNFSILAKNTHSLYGNNSLMHGRDYEPEAGLYFYRNRYYHPQLGRFLQQDPMSYTDSMNLYQAFGMNPVNFTDPFGLYTDYYWEAKENKIVKKGTMPQNPADEMTRAALVQHGKNTAHNLGLVAIAQVPVVGKPFVAGYAVRQVGEGYIGYVKQRWNNVSVMESGTSKFFKKASAPLMGLFDLIGITGGVRAITDDSLSDEERGKLLMNSYNQLSWTAIGGYYGWKQLSKNNEYYLNPNEIDFSQNTAGGRGRYQIIKESMMEKGWEGDPINVVETSEGFVTIDNTRVVVARDLGMAEIPVNIHKMTDLLPESMIGRFGDATTWGEALIYRTSSQNPPLPYTGTKKIPYVKGRK
jgi:RHS repeat-associated protein